MIQINLGKRLHIELFNRSKILLGLEVEEVTIVENMETENAYHRKGYSLEIGFFFILITIIL